MLFRSWTDRSWEVKTWSDAQQLGLPRQEKIPGRREITVRSMMGDFGGNAGLLSLWFDYDAWEWQYEYVDCPLGRQHFWWLVHILDLMLVTNVMLLGLVSILQANGVDVDKSLQQSFECVQKRVNVYRDRGTRRTANGASEKKD